MEDKNSKKNVNRRVKCNYCNQFVEDISIHTPDMCDDNTMIHDHLSGNVKYKDNFSSLMLKRYEGDSITGIDE